jgi:ABC-2 type transport system permease protein
MNASIIAALLRKDLVLFFSNRFFALITFLALFAYAIIYYLLPAEINETLELALFAPDLPTSLINELSEEGLVIINMESEQALKDAVLEGRYPVGVVLPSDFVPKLISGQTGQVHLYFSADFDNEFKDMYAIIFTEIAYMISGKPLNIQVTEEILGDDRSGDQIAYRDRLLPLLVVMILTFETMGLASLIASEVSAGTLTALLVTPVRGGGVICCQRNIGCKPGIHPGFLVDGSCWGVEPATINGDCDPPIGLGAGYRPRFPDRQHLQRHDVGNGMGNVGNCGAQFTFILGAASRFSN